MKKSSKILILVVSIVCIIGVSIFFIFKDKIIKGKENNQVENKIEINKNNIVNESNNLINNTVNNITNNKINNVNKNTTSNTTKNETSSDTKTVNEIEISLENKILCVAQLQDFNDGKKLTTDQYLNAAYTAINRGYVNLNKTNNTYTVDEINSIIYTLFGRKLSENKSIAGLKYKNGVYEFDGADGDAVPVAKNIEEDVAAGTVYVNYDLYYASDNNDDEYKGKYFISLGKNTENGKEYITSKKAQ